MADSPRFDRADFELGVVELRPQAPKALAPASQSALFKLLLTIASLKKAQFWIRCRNVSCRTGGSYSMDIAEIPSLCERCRGPRGRRKKQPTRFDLYEQAMKLVEAERRQKRTEAPRE